MITFSYVKKSNYFKSGLKLFEYLDINFTFKAYKLTWF